MKKALSIVIIVCYIMSAFLFSVAEETTKSSDATFDLSSEQQKIAELGIPTVSSVGELKKNAEELWKAKDYKNAAEAYAIYAKQANWLANIITAGLDPFYGASSSARKSFSISEFNKDSKYNLINAEKKANEYKRERNRAMLYEGLCYYHLNDYETGLPLLIKALDLIDIEDTVNWKLGMEALYSIVGY